MAGSSYYSNKKVVKKKSYGGKKYYGPYNKTNQNLIARAWRSIRECNKSNSSIDFAYKINYAFSACFNSNGGANGGGTGVAAINLYDVLYKSENFKNMAKNWDQVKINGCNCRLNICDAVLSYADMNNIKSINVITGWDRSGISLSDVEFRDEHGVLIDQDHWDESAAKKYVNTIGARVAQGYGCKKGLVNSFQRFSRYESCFPSGIEEKSCYVPTSTFKDYNGTQNPNTGEIAITNDFSSQVVNTQISQTSPNVPFEGAVKWKPTLLVGVFSTTIQRNQSADVVNPKFIEYCNLHPSEDEALAYDRKIGVVNNQLTKAQIYQLIANYIKPSNVELPAFYDAALKGFNSQNQNFITPSDGAWAQGDIDNFGNYGVEIGSIRKTLNQWIIDNTVGWQQQSSPYPTTTKSDNYGETIGDITPYGSVQPIVFNGEFTIAVTFKQQKGDM